MEKEFSKFKQIKISLSDNHECILRLYSIYEKEPDFIFIDSINGFDVYGVPCTENDENERRTLFEYNKNPSGIFEKLRLYETKNYFCEYDENCSLKIENENELAPLRSGENQISFKVVNYLGKSAFHFENNGKYYSFPFEIIPLKISYEDDYVKLTDDIAELCSQLLLDYSSPANLYFHHKLNEQKKSSLEMFLFIRKFCSSENIDYIMQCIKANPDRILVHENEFKPYGTAPISKSFFTNPFSNSKNWYKQENGSFMPKQITTCRKYDSYNTPANQFLKFAFMYFNQVCQNLIDTLEGNYTYKNEAVYLKQALENILLDPFFNDVQDLTSLPINNQVLQKREGYAQVFNAFNMLDLAMQLDWEGEKKVYEGQARNVALLYEYWLVFKLIEILKNLGAEFDLDLEKDTDVKHMLSIKNGLLVSIKEGETSLISALLKDRNMKIMFYYNKTFSKKDFDGTNYQGSYSRPFRPDYTLSIFPSIYNEKQAIEAGEVSFIHFDAKYRVSDITSLFGKENQNATDFDDEKKNETMNTYNRGDLLKMHTYNDAIRKTIGSYVLYPGISQEEKKFNVYDELLPGVGAFAIRPGDKKRTGEKQIEKFISDVIVFKSYASSRQYRKEFFDNIIIKSPSTPLQDEKEALLKYESNKPIYIMCGMIRNDYIKYLNEKHILPRNADDKGYKLINNTEELLFYYHAIKDNVVYALHANTSVAKYFCGSQTDFGKTSFIKLEDWTANIVKSELVSAEKLKERLYQNCEYRLENPKADFYYLVTLNNVKWHGNEIAGTVYKAYENIGNMAASPYSPKIIEVKK
ncbi:MAG: DUF2357 domain-containing protein [Treponema sp.]|nr:DUF2357 domain-containing protein [Treponema sp.]